MGCAHMIVRSLTAREILPIEKCVIAYMHKKDYLLENLE